VIDGGAYLGFYTVLAARRVGPAGTVFAFEPDPQSFGMLRRNIGENGFEDRVIALRDRCANVDDALGARPVDLVRLELEGGEVAALRGMRRTLASSPDPCLIVECSPIALGRAGTSPRTLLRELEAAGFEIYAIDDEGWELHPIDEVPVAGASKMNLYCRRA
jgi:hypothetical protein